MSGMVGQRTNNALHGWSLMLATMLCWSAVLPSDSLSDIVLHNVEDLNAGKWFGVTRLNNLLEKEHDQDKPIENLPPSMSHTQGRYAQLLP